VDSRFDVTLCGVSGEGGIRTLGDLATTPVFETGSAETQPVVKSKACENNANNLASCLALLAKKSPDLVHVVENWHSIPEAIRAGIIAMVKAATGTDRG
jgi:hypothetical protein